MASIFSAEALNQIVSETLKDVPADHTIAFVAATDQKGLGIAATFKKNTTAGTWDFKTYAHHDWTGDNVVGASVMFSR